MLRNAPMVGIVVTISPSLSLIDKDGEGNDMSVSKLGLVSGELDAREGDVSSLVPER